MTVAPVDLGEFEPLRWGVLLHRPGRRAQLIAKFLSDRERDAYLLSRNRAERRVAGAQR